jgi:hypothetical protein
MVRASVVGADAAYEMFDVASLDATGARLIGPLLLEIGEEVTLRITSDGTEVEVRARVTRVERGERDPATVIEFVDEAPERLAPLLTSVSA